jgi:molybdenum cofactor biosynthesis enzyme
LEMSVAATPARGDFSTSGTMVRAVSSDSLRGGAVLHAASTAAIATLKITCLLDFMT